MLQYKVGNKGEASLKKQLILKKLFEYFMMVVSAFVTAIAVYVFVNPNKTVPGGITGVATTICNLFPQWDISTVYLVLNAPILVTALIFLRGDYTFKTMVASLGCSFFMGVFEKVAPDFVFTDSQLIASIMAGLMLGLSMYIPYLYSGSNGGTEIFGKLAEKYRPEWNFSLVITIVNMLILVVGSYFMISTGGDFMLVICSGITIVVGGKVLDMLAQGFEHPKKFMIVTTQHQQMTQAVLDKFNRGVTILDMYNLDGTLKETKMVLVVVQFRQAAILRRLIKKVDDQSFAFVKDVGDVWTRPTFNRSYNYDKKI